MESGSPDNKIIVILGPTSSGKSDVAIKLAKKFNGEIISADSRQIYRGLDIGTGKVCGTWNVPACRRGRERKSFISENIPHYLIDIVSPRTSYSAAEFKKDADKIIKDVLKRGKVPIICGGTGFWIKAIVDNVVYPEVKPDWKLRDDLNKKPAEELFLMLKKLDPDRAKTIDAKNKVRLIRAIEICKTLGKVPSLPASPAGGQPSPEYRRGGNLCPSLPYSGEMSRTRDREGSRHIFLQIGISLPKEKLQENIRKRLQQRFNEGMIEEVERLHYKDKLSWKRLESFGLGYSLIPKYLRGEIASREELFEQVFQTEKDYAKRQMTWFRKDKRIIWLENYKDIEKEVKIFLKN